MAGFWFWKYEDWGNGDFIRISISTNIPVAPDSVVMASITELDENNQPFVGAATLEVHNVAPKAQGWIDVIAAIRWDNPLHYRVSLFVITM